MSTKKRLAITKIKISMRVISQMTKKRTPDRLSIKKQKLTGVGLRVGSSVVTSASKSTKPKNQRSSSSSDLKKSSRQKNKKVKKRGENYSCK